MTPAISASKSQQTAQLLEDIQQNLLKFGRHTDTCKWETFWFSNEFPEERWEKRIQLAESFAQLPKQKSLSEYRISILTGEGGLSQALPELADSSDMTLQLDCNPLILQFHKCFLAECRKAEKYTDSHKVLNRAIEQLRALHPNLSDTQIGMIRYQFGCYKTGMKRHLFSSAERFADFKRCQDHPVQQICLNYFVKEDVATLSQILKRNNAVVIFINISNVCDYPMEFYPLNTLRNEVAGVTPSQHLHQLPFSKDAICAYSQLFGNNLFTATCPVDKMEKHLYATAINQRDRELKSLSKKYHDPLYSKLYDAEEPNSDELQAPTKIFQFFAERPHLKESEWILPLTAAHLSHEEIRELRSHQEEIKALCLYRLSNLSHQDTQSAIPLLCQILDQVVAHSSTTTHSAATSGPSAVMGRDITNVDAATNDPSLATPSNDHSGFGLSSFSRLSIN